MMAQNLLQVLRDGARLATQRGSVRASGTASERLLTFAGSACHRWACRTAGIRAHSTNFRGSATEFPCTIVTTPKGPEPQYERVNTGYQTFTLPEPFHCQYNKGLLPEVHIAYETWGKLNQARDNAVLVFTGLSASSHARSQSENPLPGWWEEFVGPGKALNTSEFFVICANHIGGCYGSTGPSSINLLTGQPYATTFPIISVEAHLPGYQLFLEKLTGFEQSRGGVALPKTRGTLF
ncbi:hypothetical protein RvY_18354 [Ramazzottius varieornatus]|uniref:Uncharacterized protein n=1 Tax=Ramazzottius varieornatus TaxID=947166 RepID=A0A1D1W5F5_RAMVA|nr:hypothetical protein RvY_18354 [Ramazzottius varieornatus]